MKITDDQPSGLSALDRPTSYIGRSERVPRAAGLNDWSHRRRGRRKSGEDTHG